MSILITFILCISLLGSKNEDLNNLSGSTLEDIEILRKNYKYFIDDVSKMELWITWIKLFVDSTYKLDGNPRYNEFDCSSAVIYCLNIAFGANFANENVKALDKRINKLLDLREIELRTKYSSISTKDLIIFHPLSNGSWHCGVIINKNKGIIQYLDMNGRMDRMGVSEIKWNSGRIRKIVKISFSLWLGKLLSKYK